LQHPIQCSDESDQGNDRRCAAGEFDFYKKGRRYDERFIPTPTPDPVIRAMLEAALAISTTEKGAAPSTPSSRIVTASVPADAGINGQTFFQIIRIINRMTQS